MEVIFWCSFMARGASLEGRPSHHARMRQAGRAGVLEERSSAPGGGLLFEGGGEGVLPVVQGLVVGPGDAGEGEQERGEDRSHGRAFCHERPVPAPSF